MKVIILLSILVVALASRTEFLQFQKKFNKVYPTQAEFTKRYEIFQENMKIAKDLTLKNNGSARFGATKFSDLSQEEFAKLYLMPNYKKAAPHNPVPIISNYVPKVGGPDPNNWDWSTQGATTPVKDQGQCGSCWAFSATETIESYFYLGGGSITALSVEQIVDCDTTDQGCNGGNTNTAYQYVESAGGQDLDSDYPYTAGNGQSGTCQSGSYQAKVQVTSYNTVSGETGLYQQASSGGPVSVCVDASSWQNYQGGVLTSCTNNIDHCVQLTGYANYGSSNAYWIVRNSWGTSWGESGFIWVQIGQDLCSIGDDATIVTATSV